MTQVPQFRVQSTVVGAGLVALDVVVNVSTGESPRYFAGGTCGNVLTILSFLGWQARPIAMLKDDGLSQLLIDDLEQWGVDTSFVSRTPDGSTPVIIEKIREAADGTRSHSFSLRCPCCGAYLPGYKSIRAKSAEQVSEMIGHPQVFFLDRVSRGTLTLAKSAREQGALVVFEPSGMGEPRLFREAWSVAHVVKYANDRLRDITDLDLECEVRGDLLLKIETLGASGLRYRSRLSDSETSGWNTLQVIAPPRLRDAAGAGDWCTAGVLHKLARGGLAGFRRVDEERLVHALRYGQALATWCCAFESARGGMYQVTRQRFDRQVRTLLNGGAFRLLADYGDQVPEDIRRVCPACEEFLNLKTGTNA